MEICTSGSVGARRAQVAGLPDRCTLTIRVSLDEVDVKVKVKVKVNDGVKVYVAVKVNDVRQRSGQRSRHRREVVTNRERPG